MIRKTLLLLSAILIISACNKAEQKNIIGREVVESDYSDSITEAEVVNPDGGKGVTLTYNSWIKLQLETKAFKEQTLSPGVGG